MYVLIYVLTKKVSNHIYNAHICIYIFIYVYIFVANVCTYRAKTRMRKTKRLIVVTYYFFIMNVITYLSFSGILYNYK